MTTAIDQEKRGECTHGSGEKKKALSYKGKRETKEQLSEKVTDRNCKCSRKKHHGENCIPCHDFQESERNGN